MPSVNRFPSSLPVARSSNAGVLLHRRWGDQVAGWTRLETLVRSASASPRRSTTTVRHAVAIEGAWRFSDRSNYRRLVRVRLLESRLLDMPRPRS